MEEDTKFERYRDTQEFREKKILKKKNIEKYYSILLKKNLRVQQKPEKGKRKEEAKLGVFNGSVFFLQALFGWGSGFEKMDLEGFEWIVWG